MIKVSIRILESIKIEPPPVVILNVYYAKSFCVFFVGITFLGARISANRKKRLTVSSIFFTSRLRILSCRHDDSMYRKNTNQPLICALTNALIGKRGLFEFSLGHLTLTLLDQ